MTEKSLTRRSALRLGAGGAVFAGAALTGLLDPAVALANPDLAAHRRAVKLASENAARDGLVFTPERKLAGDVVSLAQYQTGFKNQGSRGTCYAFAGVAAVEAAYKRKYGVELDLSEQYAYHMNKVFELYGDYASSTTPHENNSSYWGFQGSSDIIDHIARAAIPAESYAPYLDGWRMDQLKTATPACGNLDWNSSQEQLDAFEFLTANIPTAARENAKYRVTSFGAVPWNPSPTEIEAVIAGGHELVADVPGHCILIVGFDRIKREYLVKNSWGENKFITVPYNDPNWPILGGRFVQDVADVNAAPQWDAAWLGRWQMDHDGWRGELVIRRTTDFRSGAGQPTKLGNYYRDGNRYDVNGYTEQNGQILHFWVADGAGRVQPGSKVGTEHRVCLYSWEKAFASGVNWWSGIPFGTVLSRSALPGRPTSGWSAGDWIGQWDMNSDGWSGRLRITSVAPFQASYVHQDGRTLAVSGAVDGPHPHILPIKIAYASNDLRPYQLYAHTWERDTFSGTHQWSGLTFGNHGYRV
ncbi:C1 family peptidase [Amycolatopsis sp. cg5]|uniref:C1 family peptidase n=1 Tax=Amycolatopsis sp. cg5 TaxID=3238802 RepID=UPI0035244EE4